MGSVMRGVPPIKRKKITEALPCKSERARITIKPKSERVARTLNGGVLWRGGMTEGILLKNPPKEKTTG